MHLWWAGRPLARSAVPGAPGRVVSQVPALSNAEKAKLPPAPARYTMELAKQIDDQWLPRRAETRLCQRVFTAKGSEQFTVEFGNYRKFSESADFKVVE